MTKATKIRSILKEEHNITSRQVACRMSPGGGSIKITINDPVVSEALVRQVAAQFRSVRYDKCTGCILRGGNTFVDVAWDNNALDAIAERLDFGDVKAGDRKTNATYPATVGRLQVWRTPDHMDEWHWDILRAEGESWDDHRAQDSMLCKALGHNIFRSWDSAACKRAMARAMLHLGVDLDREMPAANAVAA